MACSTAPFRLAGPPVTVPPARDHRVRRCRALAHGTRAAQAASQTKCLPDVLCDRSSGDLARQSSASRIGQGAAPSPRMRFAVKGPEDRAWAAHRCGCARRDSGRAALSGRVSEGQVHYPIRGLYVRRRPDRLPGRCHRRHRRHRAASVRRMTNDLQPDRIGP
jgi:hypothetical protein